MNVLMKKMRVNKVARMGVPLLLAASLLAAGCASEEDRARDGLAELSLTYTPDQFVQAAANGDQKALQLFIDAGMSPDAKNAKDETALMISAQKGNVDTMKLLLKAKSDVNAAKGTGETALSYAVEASRLQAVQLLLDNGSEVNRSAGSTPLISLAVRSGNADLVKLLLDKGGDPNTQVNGSSALYEAVQKGLSDVVKLLLDAKADPDTKTPEGGHLLLYTLDHDQPENARQLIEHGADLSYRTDAGIGLLTIAKSKGYPDVVDALAAKGVKDFSLLILTVDSASDGITIPKSFTDNTMTLGAHQNHPNPQVTFNLEGKTKSFKAAFASGRRDIESNYNVKLIIEGDGKKLYESDYLSIQSAPQNIDLDTGDIQKLTFRLQADKLFDVIESKGLLQNPTVYLP